MDKNTGVNIYFILSSNDNQTHEKQGKKFTTNENQYF